MHEDCIAHPIEEGMEWEGSDRWTKVQGSDGLHSHMSMMQASRLGQLEGQTESTRYDAVLKSGHEDGVGM
jgi:hypothetical protein